jgi:photosystem II stability/assembly factor-like uncharacterized protein
MRILAASMSRMSTDRAAFVLLAVLAATAAAAGGEAKPAVWEPIGLSGGGALFAPAISPFDPRLMMVDCDMGGVYLSRDAGATWRMINHHQLRSNTRCRPAFHPFERELVYAANGWNSLAESRDGGEHWHALGNLPGDLHGEIAIDRANPALMLVGAGEGVWRSLDAGRSWSQCPGPKGAALGFHIDPHSPSAARMCFAATAAGVWRSDDGGATWKERSAGLPWRELRGFSAGSDGKQTMLYCAIPTRDEDGIFRGGIYRSANRGESWEQVPGEGLNRDLERFDEWATGDLAQYHRVLTSNARPQTVYAFNANTGIPPPHHATVFRSDDAGATWRATYFPDPRFPGCNVERDYTTVEDQQYYQDVPDGVAIDSEDPQRLLIADSGCLHVSSDGGKHWSSGHVQPGPPAPPGSSIATWRNTGLVVTTAWHHYLDPFQRELRYICYTDIGFARSLDAGASWQWWPQKGRPPWRNTCYELAFDPDVPGRIWGAFSTVHDIPNGNIIWGNHSASGQGGVAVSNDHAATWQLASGGLPEAPVTSLVLDPSTPAGRRTLYAASFGQGVFKSVDDGATWSMASEGLGAAQNRRVYRVIRHGDGTLFALVTAMRKDGRFLAEGVGLYRSRDGAAHWELANASQPLRWPKDVTVDPADSRIIYLGACDTNGPEGTEEGGLYRTRDGGATWTRLAREGREHFGAYLHPARPGWIYMTLCEGPPGSGLWLSKDDGASFAPMEGIPFSNIQRVEFDPADAGVIYVSTFGGSVWRGPASE